MKIQIKTEVVRAGDKIYLGSVQFSSETDPMECSVGFYVVNGKPGREPILRLFRVADGADLVDHHGRVRTEDITKYGPEIEALCYWVVPEIMAVVQLINAQADGAVVQYAVVQLDGLGPEALVAAIKERPSLEVGDDGVRSVTRDLERLEWESLLKVCIPPLVAA